MVKFRKPGFINSSSVGVCKFSEFTEDCTGKQTVTFLYHQYVVFVVSIVKHNRHRRKIGSNESEKWNLRDTFILTFRTFWFYNNRKRGTISGIRSSFIPRSIFDDRYWKPIKPSSFTRKYFNITTLSSKLSDPRTPACHRFRFTVNV